MGWVPRPKQKDLGGPALVRVCQTPNKRPWLTSFGLGAQTKRKTLADQFKGPPDPKRKTLVAPIPTIYLKKSMDDSGLGLRILAREKKAPPINSEFHPLGV